MLAAHTLCEVGNVLGVREIARVRARPMSRIDERPRPCLRLIREPIDHQHSRPALRERARDDLTYLPLATNTCE